MTDTDDYGLEPVRFSRLSRRGVILGLSIPQCAVLGIGLVAFVATLYVAGGTGLLVSSPIWVGSAVAAWTPISRRPIIEWLPVAGHWAIRVLARQTVYRRRITKPRPAGTLNLPGDAAALRTYEDPDTGAVMVHDPLNAALTVMLDIEHRSFLLLDAAEQQRRITGWGRVLSTACRAGRTARLQILERTVPDSGTGLSTWWKRHGSDDRSWAATTYKELIDRAGPAGERHISTLALSLDMNAAGRAIRAVGGGLRGAAHVLRQDMNGVRAALGPAELQPGDWYTNGDLAIVLRAAYDPAIAATLQQHPGLGQDLATAGPITVEESWNHMRSDSAYHAVLWISEWPRSAVYPGFLAPLVLTPGVRRCFSIICDPIRSDKAARDLRKKKVEHITDAAQRRRIGQIEDAGQVAEYQDVLQQEHELTAGHGILRYTGLIAISAPTTDKLESTVAEIEQAAVQASCETRRLVGQQAQAFTAAALPLGRGL